MAPLLTFSVQEGTMGRARISIMWIVAVILIAYFAINAIAGGKLAMLEYNLKPVASLDAGRRIKTEWSAKVRNRAPETVSFTITIFFVDANNEEITQAKAQCELNARETKTFTDTVILDAALANKIASTRVSMDETQ